MLPSPTLAQHEGFTVVRDDLLPGGTKRRAIHVFFDHHEEYVYASPVYGYAQLALAYACHDHEKHATIFCAKRKTRFPLTNEVMNAGATVVEVDHGYLSVVKARARDYCEQLWSAKLLPFGLDTPEFIEALAGVARELPVQPREVWSVIGSGALTRALQLAWPAAAFFGVRIGTEAGDPGRAQVFAASEPYEKAARRPPPFPSSAQYDAKAWSFLKEHASPGALFWNVGA